MAEGSVTAAGNCTRWKGYALAIVAALCWAVGGVAAKWMLSTEGLATEAWRVPPLGIAVEPTVLAGGRALAAFAILFAYIVVFRRRALRIRLSDLPFLVLFGVIGLAGVHFTYFQAIAHASVAIAILLQYLAPVLVLLFAVAVMREPFTWKLPAGVVLSISGCAFVVGVLGGGGLTVSAAALGWGLAAALFFAAYSIMGHRATARFSPWTLLCYGLGFAGLFWMLYLNDASWADPLLSDPLPAGVIVFIAVASTIVPFGLFLKALHFIDPTRATIVATLEPVSAGVIAFAVFGESFGASQLFGAVLVLVAIIIVQWRGVPEPSPPDAVTSKRF